MDALELALSSVQCSVEGCDVSPVRGRICKAHRPRFMEDEEILPALDRVLVVLERNPELNDLGIAWLAKTPAGGRAIRNGRVIYQRKLRAKYGRRERWHGG